MKENKNYYIRETYRHLALALIGCRDTTRKHIEKAIECLQKYENQKK